MGDISPERKTGCGLINAVFGRKSLWAKKTTTQSSIPSSNDKNSNNEFAKTTATQDSKRRRGTSDEISFLPSSAQHQQQPHHPKHVVNSRATNNQRPQQQQIITNDNRKQETCYQTQNKTSAYAYVNQGTNRKVPKESITISGELESMIIDHQKNKGSSTLVRASSSNVMLFGNLGNLRQQQQQPNGSVLDHHNHHNHNQNNNHNHVHSKQRSREENPINNNYTNVTATTTSSNNNKTSEPVPSGSLCRAISTRMDPETLKIMGNEDYKNGRFAEALALYDAAISIDPNKASYRSNKSAALTALGRLLEAVLECREALRIEPHYHRAHLRLATLYLRLGEPEKATYHYKHAGQEADRDDLAKVKSIQIHLNRCTEARKTRDWNTLIKEADFAISAGADSAPQIYALQAEALLKLHRHQEADTALSRGPKFDVDECTKVLGPIGNASLLVTRALVDLASGRFDDAVEAAQRAGRLDVNNREANGVMRKAKGIATARSKGNELFKASRFSEACVAYGEGLEHDPYNSVLLCNRAACRSKLGQFDKAINDCTVALNLRPSYAKARLRRADCNAKLGRWEASIQDYEALLEETPEDEEVKTALSEVQAQFRRKIAKDSNNKMENGGAGAL
ncbi:inactive TPR repeat-containing thioredoxin TTL3-like [Cannabis sativa]|uniref:inactive TPR repeat-containing thioredoxin TTL3-like n=1 Tax=Cannabis sativa TaxID=3483 RepID=UPI0029CA1ACE|nr:inactive TPR repeat-containing thioredoxin TTL3-like [Cannabis sativa]